MKKIFYTILFGISFLLFTLAGNAQSKHQIPPKSIKQIVSVDGKQRIKSPDGRSAQSNSNRSGGIELPTQMVHWDADSLGNFPIDDSAIRYSAVYNNNAMLEVLNILSYNGDSILRVINTYNEFNMIASELEQNYTNGFWMDSDLRTWDYDFFGNDTLYQEFEYTEVTKAWILTWAEKHYYTYSGDIITSDIIQHYNETNGEFYNYIKYTFEYENTGFSFRLTQTEYNWNSTIGDWEASERVIIDMDSESYVLTEVLVQHYNIGILDFENDVKISDFNWYAYYGSFDGFYWDEESGGFHDVNLTQDDKGFDVLIEPLYFSDFAVRSKIESCMVYQWDSTGGYWTDLERFNYVFDNFGGYNGVKEIYDGAWVNSRKAELIIDSKGNFEEYLDYEWEQGDWYHDGGAHFINTYEGDLITHCVFQEWDWQINDYRNVMQESFDSFTSISGDCQAGFELFTNDSVLGLLNLSSGSFTNLLIDFGDGTALDSISEFVEHIYQEPGYYTVCLGVFDVHTNCVSDTCAIVEIGATNQCLANFSYTNTSGLEYSFINESAGNIDYTHWQFGDGEVSTDISPTHSYSQPGYYNVILTVASSTNGCMDVFESIVVVGDPTADCQADFIYFADPATNIVYFTNTSYGNIDMYYWNFGDGFQEASMNPVHQYTSPGYYPVCLSVWNNDQTCFNTSCQSVYISGNALCHAEFFQTIDQDTKTITCNDNSMGDVIHWQYAFGNGAGGNTPNVVYTYSDTGIYLVSLNIITSEGCSDNYYSVANIGSSYQGLIGLFGHEELDGGDKANGHPVNFKGAVYGEPSRAVWTFGDGSVDSTTLYPTHYYQTTGIYEVCLTVSNQLLGQSYTHCNNVPAGMGIDKINTQQTQMLIYPNPMIDKAIVDVFVETADVFTIEIFDIMGNKVTTVHQGKLNKGKHTFNISKNELKSGVFIINLSSKQFNQVKRIIIQ